MAERRRASVTRRRASRADARGRAVPDPASGHDAATRRRICSRSRCRSSVATSSMLFLAGLPPYGPGDLIDVDIDEDGGDLDLDGRSLRPAAAAHPAGGARRLRSRDRAGGDTRDPGRTGARGGAREAPRRARPGDARRGGRHRGAPIAGAAPPQLEAVRAAREAHERAPAHVRRRRARASARTVWSSPRRSSPARATGTWRSGTSTSTTSACCGSTGSHRWSRRGSGFEPRGLRGAGRPLYTPERPRRRGARAAASRRPLGRRVLRRDRCRRGSDGSVDVTLPTGTMGWIARLFLRLGRDADVLEPAGLRDEIAAQARATLAIYLSATA